MRIGSSFMLALFGLTVSLFSTPKVQAATFTWSTADGGNGNTYETVLRPNGITWEEAQLEAEATGGHLVTITSAAENAIIHSLIADIPELWISGDAVGNNTLGPWIGAFQPPGTSEPTDGFTWVTGETFTFANWSGSEPNDIFDIGEDVVHFFGVGVDNFAATWNDLPSNFTLIANGQNPLGYVIEYDGSPSSIPEPGSILALTLFGTLGVLRNKKGRSLRRLD